MRIRIRIAAAVGRHSLVSPRPLFAQLWPHSHTHTHTQWHAHARLCVPGANRSRVCGHLSFLCPWLVGCRCCSCGLLNKWTTVDIVQLLQIPLCAYAFVCVRVCFGHEHLLSLSDKKWLTLWLMELGGRSGRFGFMTWQVGKVFQCANWKGRILLTEN